MGLWTKLVQGLRAWRRPDEADLDLRDEIDDFMARAVEDLIARGVAPDEARRRVRLEYGDPMTAREDVRASLWESVLHDLGLDLRLAVRRLRRSPAFAFIVTGVLGVGIGATTAIVSVVRPVLFDPLPYPDSERIVSVADRGVGGDPIPLAFGTVVELRARADAYELLAAHKPWQPTLASRGAVEAERVDGQRVSASYLAVLGVRPSFGPGFDPAADRPGERGQVVLSHDLWTRRFDADRDVIGQTARFDRELFTVVGVMPASFRDVVRPGAEVWGLLQYGATDDWNTREWGHHLGLIGRLRPGVDLEGGRRALAAVADHPVADHSRPPWAALDGGLSVEPLDAAVTRTTRPVGLALLGAVGVLLAIACVDLIILLVARGLRRRDELALRAALGAGRPRLIRQLTTEALALAVLGGLAALGVAHGLIGVLAGIAPPGFLGATEVVLDQRAVIFAGVVTGAVGLVAGLLPAWSVTTRGTARSGRRGGTLGRPLTRILITAEVALAFVLLVGSGLLVRTMAGLNALPLGFTPSEKVVLQVHANSLEGDDEAIHAFWDGVLAAAREVPGVRSLGLTSQLPLSGEADAYGVGVHEEGRGEEMDGTAYRYAIDPEYLDVMGIPRVEGRGITISDRPGAPPAVVVSRSLARTLFPGGAVGERLRVGAGMPPFEVVGVVDDVPQQSLEGRDTDAVYVAARQWSWADRTRWVVVDVGEVEPEVVGALRSAIRSAGPDQPIVRVEALEAVIEQSEAQRRFVMAVITAFALFATTLATLGLYGVMATGVAERTHEMGVRAALGATRSSIVGLILRQGMAIVLLGLVVGVGLALGASRLLGTLLYGVTAVDPLTYAGVAAFFALVCGVACSAPAIRAARMDPLETLRSE